MGFTWDEEGEDVWHGWMTEAEEAAHTAAHAARWAQEAADLTRGVYVNGHPLSDFILSSGEVEPLEWLAA